MNNPTNSTPTPADFEHARGILAAHNAAPPPMAGHHDKAADLVRRIAAGIALSFEQGRRSVRAAIDAIINADFMAGKPTDSLKDMLAELEKRGVL